MMFFWIKHIKCFVCKFRYNIDILLIVWAQSQNQNPLIRMSQPAYWYLNASHTGSKRSYKPPFFSFGGPWLCPCPWWCLWCSSICFLFSSSNYLNISINLSCIPFYSLWTILTIGISMAYCTTSFMVIKLQFTFMTAEA